MIKVAIVDDGVKEDKNLIIRKSICIESNLHIHKASKKELEYSVHGSNCARIINNYYSKIEIYSIKILKQNTCATKKQLIRAIEWCILHHIKVINMSLGTIDFRDFQEIEMVLCKAHQQGIIMVAACHNSNIFTLPASSKYVIGVKSIEGLNEGRYYYHSHPLDGIDITACSQHKLKNSVEKTSMCNSYAAPMITAEVCRILNENKHLSLNNVRKKIVKDSVNGKLEIEKAKKQDEKDYYYISSCKYNEYNICKDLDIPIIVLYDDNMKNVEEMMKEIKKQFYQDDYNLLTITTEQHYENSVDEILPIIKKTEEKQIKDRLEKLYAVYNNHIFILGCNKKWKIQAILNEVEVDLIVLPFKYEKNGLNQMFRNVKTIGDIYTIYGDNGREVYQKIVEVLSK